MSDLIDLGCLSKIAIYMVGRVSVVVDLLGGLNLSYEINDFGRFNKVHRVI